MRFGKTTCRALLAVALMTSSGVARADAYDVHLVPVCAATDAGSGSGHLSGDFQFLDGGANSVDHVTGTIAFVTQGSVTSAGIQRSVDAGADSSVVAVIMPSKGTLGVDMVLYSEPDNVDLENGRMFVQINSDLCPGGELRGTLIQVIDGLDASSFPPPSDAGGSSAPPDGGAGPARSESATHGGCAAAATTSIEALGSVHAIGAALLMAVWLRRRAMRG